MSLYRKKPVVVEARRITDENILDVAAWADQAHTYTGSRHGHTDPPWSHHTCMLIETLEGGMSAYVGDWVIKGVQGEFYPCKPDIFEATYELADGGEAS